MHTEVLLGTCPLPRIDTSEELLWPPKVSEEVSNGTTVLALKFNGGVILAADTRSSTGDYVSNRVTRKISRLHKKIFVAASGSRADTQLVAGIARRYIGEHAIEIADGSANPIDKQPTVKAAASLVRLLCYNNKDMLSAGLIVAGWDPRNGVSIYSIPLGGSMLPQEDFAIGGSGSTYIYALMDSTFKKGMSKEEAKAFAKKIVAHAMMRDGSSGGCIRTTTVTSSGVEEDFTPGDKVEALI
eukprot:Filipodium_phascolosomae@DN3380_c0_g1_i1.p1